MASGSTFKTELAQALSRGDLPPRIGEILGAFYESYIATLRDHGLSSSVAEPIFTTYLNLVSAQLKSPFPFEPFHRALRAPIDYYKFGSDFFEPLIDRPHSSVQGHDHLGEIVRHLQSGSNVIFFSNHQTEADPQVLSLLLDPLYPGLAEKMIFVAGERVVTDPLAVPFSKGRNLLCIYSKRYIDHPPEEKNDKLLHNQRTMERMRSLLSGGGQCIYVAPSGGRDRIGPSGAIEIAPFDPQSIEMFHLMARRAKTPTLFYPMAIASYDLLPPPETVQLEIGEQRSTARGDLHLKIGQPIDMDHFPGGTHTDRHLKRKARATYIWEEVVRDYRTLTQG
jgi:glycerol-3-phosphate O-acyltransferase